MTTLHISIDPLILTSLRLGTVDYDRLDSTTELEIAAQRRLDDEEALQSIQEPLKTSQEI